MLSRDGALFQKCCRCTGLVQKCHYIGGQAPTEHDIEEPGIVAESDEPGMGERIREYAQFPNIVDHGGLIQARAGPLIPLILILFCLGVKSSIPSIPCTG